EALSVAVSPKVVNFNRLRTDCGLGRSAFLCNFAIGADAAPEEGDTDWHGQRCSQCERLLERLLIHEQIVRKERHQRRTEALSDDVDEQRENRGHLASHPT